MQVGRLVFSPWQGRKYREDAEHMARLLREIDFWRGEAERLTTENWQLKQACGYPIPADKETVDNPFKCGPCEAKTNEIERLQALLARLRDYLSHL